MAKPKKEFPPIEGWFLGIAASGRWISAVGVHHPGETTLVQSKQLTPVFKETVTVPFPVVGKLFGATGSRGNLWGVGYEWTKISAGWKLRTLIFSVHPQSGWKRDTTPNVDWTFDVTGLADNWLMAVSASSPTDVWAVGKAGDYLGLAGNQPIRCIALHWDGANWTTVVCDQIGYGPVLNGVVSINPKRAYAVGSYNLSTTVNKLVCGTLVQRWDGQAWTVVKSPNSGLPINVLNAVCSVGDKELWAVGHAVDENQQLLPLILHFKNSTWSVAPALVGVNGTLRGVSAANSADVWAVGVSSSNSAPLILHFDGQKWAEIAPAQIALPASPAGLEAVVALAPNDVWAAGHRADPNQAQMSWKMVMHWNGTLWSEVPCQ